MIRNILTVAIWVFLTRTALSKPMDLVIGEKYLPRARNIVAHIKKGVSLTNEDKAFLKKGLENKNSVIMAVSAWGIGQAKIDDEETLNKLRGMLKGKDDMVKAFVRLAIEKINYKGQFKDILKAKQQELYNEKNPYLKVEVIKYLLKTEKAYGLQTLRNELVGKDTKTKRMLFSLYKKHKDELKGVEIKPIPNPTDSHYGQVLRIIGENEE